VSSVNISPVAEVISSEPVVAVVLDAVHIIGGGGRGEVEASKEVWRHSSNASKQCATVEIKLGSRDVDARWVEVESKGCEVELKYIETATRQKRRDLLAREESRVPVSEWEAMIDVVNELGLNVPVVVEVRRGVVNGRNDGVEAEWCVELNRPYRLLRLGVRDRNHEE